MQLMIFFDFTKPQVFSNFGTLFECQDQYSFVGGESRALSSKKITVYIQHWRKTRFFSSILLIKSVKIALKM